MTNNDQNDNLIDDTEESTIGMDEIDSFDFGRAGTLMDVMAKCATIGVKATSISGLAAAALEEMNEEAKAIARRRADAVQAEEAKRREALEAQRRQQEEDERLAAEKAAEKTVEPHAIPNDKVSKTTAIAENNARRL